MSVVIRSLVNYAQTLDSVSLPAWKSQSRSASTAALVAAVAARTIQLDNIDDTNKQEASDETVYVYTPLTGTSQAVPADAELVLVNPAGTIAAFSMSMPAASYDGQRITMAFDAVITTLTMTAAGSDTLKGALTAAAAKGFATWRYRLADTSWYRVA